MNSSKTRKNVLFFALLATALFLLSACAKPFVVACREAARDPLGSFRWTEAQARVGCARAQLYASPHLTVFNKEKGVWSLNPNGLPTEQFEKVMENQAKSLNSLLSYKDKAAAEFIDQFAGFRKGLEREEAKVLWILQQLYWVRTYNKFTDLVGELPPAMRSRAISYFFPAGRKFLSMRIYYPPRSLQDIPFTAEYLEIAKKGGVLRQVDEFKIEGSQQFAKKIPNLYDPNDFNWDAQSRGWNIVSYKVLFGNEKPTDNTVHYIEGFRKSESGAYETQPALRGFLAAGGKRVTVFVLDYDKEGKSGYGSSDEVIQTFVDITTGSDLFAAEYLRGQLLDSLYEEPRNNRENKPERRRPRDPEIYAEIVKMGEIKIDVWENGDWNVPFEYKQLPSSIDIAFDMPKSAEEKRLAEKENLKRIKMLKREYKESSESVVVELWKPKLEYAEWDVRRAEATPDGVITILRKGRALETAEIEHFADQAFGKKMPRIIMYRFGGKWYQIVDEDGDGIFEKRRIVASPEEKVDFGANNAGTLWVP